MTAYARNKLFIMMEFLPSGTYFLFLIAGCYATSSRSFDAAGEETDFLPDEDATAPENWIITLGGPLNDSARLVIESRDGSYVLAGLTGPWGEDDNILVNKISPAGGVLWKRTIGGSEYELVHGLVETAENEIIVAGSMYSFGVGDEDAWIIKLNENGLPIWQNTYGGSKFECLLQLASISDGGFVAVGNTGSFGNYNGDMWVIKINGEGEIIWQKAVKASPVSWASGIAECGNGDFVIVGFVYQGAANEEAVHDAYVAKFDDSGNVIWQKVIGGELSDGATAVLETNDGGVLVAGMTKSFGLGQSDAWILKLSGDGSLLWQKTFGGAGDEWMWDIREKSDGNIIAVNGGIMILEPNAGILWQEKIGADGSYGLISAVEDSNGNLVLVGTVDPLGVEIYQDVLLMKLNGVGGVSGACSLLSPADAVARESFAEIRDADAIVIDTDATVQSTNAVMNDFDGTISFLCPE